MEAEIIPFVPREPVRAQLEDLPMSRVVFAALLERGLINVEAETEGGRGVHEEPIQ